MSKVFCLDITEMAPSVSAFQLVRIFGLHEVLCFPNCMGAKTEFTKAEDKRKNIKETKLTQSPGGRILSALKKQRCEKIQGQRKIAISRTAVGWISRMSSLTGEMSNIFHTPL